MQSGDLNWPRPMPAAPLGERLSSCRLQSRASFHREASIHALSKVGLVLTGDANRGLDHRSHFLRKRLIEHRKWELVIQHFVG